ncbi:MAG: DJ-1/PfpI family protein [Actinomycetota bacterium]|nr:DJ-1/PfpI family protein [Actinomycetota bacterium]
MTAGKPCAAPVKVTFDIVLFEGVDELDVVGPFEVLRRAEALGAGLAVRLCSRAGTGPVRGAFGLVFQPDCEFVPGAAGVVVVPGGGWVARADVGAWAEVKRGDWPRLLSESASAGSVIVGICTGAMLLAHAGLLQAHRATTHHDAQADLAMLGVEVVSQRVVDEGPVVTSGGVTSGMDLALWLVSRYFGESLAGVVADGLEYPWAAPGPLEEAERGAVAQPAP